MAKQKHRVYASYPRKTDKSYSDSQGSHQDIPTKADFPGSVGFKTSREDILGYVHAHKNNKAYTKDKKPGPARIIKLDDITAYDISEDEETLLWELEVDRLIQSAKDTASAVPFEGSAAFPEPNAEASYDGLSGLADQLLVNLHVCRVDNGTVVFDLSNKNHNDAEYANSFNILRERQEQERGLRDKAGDSARSVVNMAKYCALVDYVTAITCRIAVSVFEDKHWHGLVLSSLSKYAAKLKVLAMDPDKFAQRSVNMASRSKQYKALLDGIGSTLRMMQKQSRSGAIHAGFKGQNQEDEGNENNDDDNDGDEGDGKMPRGLYPKHGQHMLHYAPYDLSFGSSMGGAGMGTMGGIGGMSGMGGMGGLGGMGGMTSMGSMGGMGGMGRIGGTVGRGGLGRQWYTPLYSEARLKELEAFTQKTEADESSHYFSYTTLINNWTSSTLLYIIRELKAPFDSEFPSDGFDICSIVYEAGTVDCTVPVLLHQDRGTELSGTNNVKHIQYSYMGFWLAQKAAIALNTPKRGDSGSVRSGSVSAMSAKIEIQNTQTGAMAEAVSLELRDLSQAIGILIPLLCTAPDFVSSLQSSVSGLRELFPIESEEHMLPRAPRFTGLLSLSTHTFESRSPGCLPQSDFKSLSWSILAKRERQTTLALKHTSTEVWNKTPAQQRHQQLQGAKSRQDKLAKEANEWVFEETAIRVNCATYVYTVLALCSALAVGGLMIGIFLGTFVKNSIALQGVDPFGFTTYAWIIAGFIMLIAKNIRVAEWPWRDFLLRRVTCRSLSELHAVTGVDEQDLLVYLLTMEYENVLKTKGPHNSIFMRREPQGFSIDVKPEVRTLLAAGIIFIKVSVRKEPVLICLDFRPGSTDSRSSIRHLGNLNNTDISCRYPPGHGDRVQDVILNQRQRHWDYMSVSWDKILGIYHDWDRKIR